MKKYVCDVCGWIYDEAAGDPENGIAPGTKFEDLGDDFTCPLCGVGTDSFSEEQVIMAQERMNTRQMLCAKIFMRICRSLF